MPAHHLICEGGREVALPTGKLDAMGKPIVRYVEVAGTWRHKPTCTRAVYQKLKHVYGRAILGALK
ncbi:hypothetical protein [Achromobacter xylosoxidans]|uniref:hypothetical protein n=1 Tax=Alcaligenes xylosoxydans xylosoxydans TaxID=85698 RepID=UPI000B490E69|nr:hypothetical protein [Achromobacter xylosoxidans]